MKEKQKATKRTDISIKREKEIRKIPSSSRNFPFSPDHHIKFAVNLCVLLKNLFLMPLILILFCSPIGPPTVHVPDVPPRNPTMNRINGRVQGIVNDLDMDFEPSCLVRTPSGNVYIPSGNLSKFKGRGKKGTKFMFSLLLLCC
jgi:hypothetical protein